MNRAGRNLWVLVMVAAIVIPLNPFQIFETNVGFKYKLKTFSSYAEFQQYIEQSLDGTIPYVYDERVSIMEIGSYSKTISAAENTLDFSTTNIQVEGVDEPDIVKTDGKYIYVVANERIYIVEAYPYNNASIISEIDTERPAEEILISDTRLVVFSSCCRYVGFLSGYEGINTASIEIYDTSDRKNPSLIKRIEVDGFYSDARMIENHVYVVILEPPYVFVEQNGDNISIIPPVIKINDTEEEIPPSSIHYIDIPGKGHTLIHVLAIDITNGELTDKLSILAGTIGTIYVSHHNIYIACPYYDVIYPLISSDAEFEEKTVIHKIAIDGGKISYESQGEVPGRVLNQFSMDEYKSFFRIATTRGNIWSGDSRNNIYVLDKNLKIVGKLENLAPGEEIYSTRFMGNRAYMVTFKKVDPLFVVDLSDPYNPKVLGKLKIPGYSDYLHPYDENHIIGIGKDTVEPAPWEKESRDIDFAWYAGLKIALFDVTDPEHPREISKVVIGDRGTNSPVLQNHKALLFDMERNLLVIPVIVCEIDNETKENLKSFPGITYGEFVFQGVYVYNISLDNGIIFRGKITHGFDGDEMIERSLYIEDVLYTISEKMIKMNDLRTLDELGKVELTWNEN